MKVVCIDASVFNDKDTKEYKRITDFWIIEGEVYNVIGRYIDEYGQLYYDLFEDPYSDSYTWECFRFIPLSEIDETELVNEREAVASH